MDVSPRRKLNLNIKIRILQLLNHILAIISILYIINIEQYYWFLISLIFWFLLGPISIGLTMHRLLTHRSFKTNIYIERFLSFLTTFSTVGPTIPWVALHRMHHATSDRIGDPHSPNINGKLSLKESIKVWLGYDWKIKNIPLKYATDLMRDPLHRWIFNNYFKIILFFCLFLLLINPMLYISIYVIPSSMVLHSLGVINIFGHGHGYRNYETKDHSTNSWIANIVSLGDGWHNNHHAHPNRYYIGEKWWEWDLIGLIIHTIKK